MFGASWGTDDAIIFSRSQLGLFRVSAAGGTPEVIAAPDLGKGEEGRYGAEMIPRSELARGIEDAGEGEIELASANVAPSDQARMR